MVMARIENMNMELLEAHRRLAGRHQHACQALKVMSCGGMIGTALLFPIAHADGLPFRALTLSIFTLSLVAFHALHLEPFVRFGPYTAPLALLILLIIVLPGAPSKKSDIIPWLPLYVVVACLVTAAIHELPFRISSNRSTSVTQLDAGSDLALPSGNYRGYRTSSEWSEPRAPSQSYRNDPNNFQHMGPGSLRSMGTGSETTEFSLRDLEGARRDPQAGIIYGNANSDYGRLVHGVSQLATTHGEDRYDAAVDLELGQVRPSQDSVQESHTPLLGSYD